MFRFPSPRLLCWWVGRSGKKTEDEHLEGSGSREGRDLIKRAWLQSQLFSTIKRLNSLSKT